MAAEAWEEICEWEVEDDVELAQRIIIHAVPNPASSEDEGEEGDEYQFIQTFKAPTYAAAARWGTQLRASSENGEVVTTEAVSATPSKKSKAARKVVAQAKKVVTETSKPSSNVGVTAEEETFDDNRSATRRTNKHLHKLQSTRLASQLVSAAQLENWQSTVRGDTNRNPEFVKAKISKKVMRYNKGGKKERKGTQKTKANAW